MSLPSIILLIGSLLFIAVWTTKLSSRFNIPALLIFISLGMIAGSDVTGFIRFDDAELAQLFGTIALIVILFEGGLQTVWKDVKQELAPSLSLATFGVFIATTVVAVASHYILGFNWPNSFLLGAIVGSTDAAAIFSVLSGQSVRRKVGSTLEVESGTNDPMAVFLTVLFLEFVTNPQEASLLSGLFSLTWEMMIGLLLGLAIGWIASAVINRIDLSSSSFYPILLMSFGFLSFGIASAFSASGFLAVYVTAIYISNHELVYRQTLVRFTMSMAHLAQIGMFIVLGLLVFPKQLLDPQVILSSIALALILIFVARPLSVWLSLWPFKYSWREKVFISFAGLKGAVPIILATYPLVAGIDNASMIFNIVFFTVLLSTLIQGSLLSILADRLYLNETGSSTIQTVIEFMSIGKPNAEIIELTIPRHHPFIGKMISDIQLPQEFLITAIIRDDQIVTPRGDTVFEGNDQLLLLTPKHRIKTLKRFLFPKTS
ncbi:potassium/proton antiporter [Exiguobacterium oxidotolerans]|uniref:K(+)/H(+) antiporter NhaP2 n=1 Tax=Exiguobacterium oxidotolerans TaxID=223958 RepID=A0A653I3I6_9BACL|nr:potassium/proton antiporter [Exiguobacterium oxidotolerans]VWX33336.1 K(+)/H(+) antiporter NhaP2 [Exiguobacterium oxidotolerans]